jgi:poly(3-hydroxybutyrate) depolymerase
MRRALHLLPCLMAAMLLSACNGDDNDDDAAPAPPAQSPPPAQTPPPPPPAAQRGDLLETPPAKVASYGTTDLLAVLNGSAVGKAILDAALQPKCNIEVHQIRYQTVGAQNEGATASGALMVPTGTDPTCQGPRPIVLYAHGSSPNKAYNLAAVNGQDNFEAVLIAAAFAAQGYIVVAPNYAGYDTSSLTYHPYLVADQQSKDMIDALTASRKALPVAGAPGTTDGGKLFITGYSQGGYVAMATHRALQAAGAAVTASAPMSGPYTLSAFGDAIFQGQVTQGAPVNVTVLMTSYHKAYGNIYAAPTDVFEARYATGIDALLPSTTPIGDLYAQGRLPKEQLFSSTPPDPAYAPQTPATQPAQLASQFAKGFGPESLVTNAYRLAYLQDAQVQPDGGFPTTTNGLPPTAPTNTFRQALKTNDLRNWAPTAPMLLCAGNNDPTVLYLNTQLMQGYWAATAPTAPVTYLDVDSAIAPGDPFEKWKQLFSAAKDLVRTQAVLGGASDNGDAAVLENYHAGLVAPFCLGAVKSYFDAR